MKPHPRLKGIINLRSLEEDNRIKAIGDSVLAGPTNRITGVLTDANPPEKAERYVQKLKERFPLVEVIDTSLHEGAVLIRLRKKNISEHN